MRPPPPSPRRAAFRATFQKRFPAALVCLPSPISRGAGCLRDGRHSLGGGWCPLAPAVRTAGRGPWARPSPAGPVPAPPGLGGLPPRERAGCPELALATASTSVPTQAGPTPPVLGAGPQAFVPVTPAAVLGDVHVPLCGTRTPVSSLGPGHLRPSEWSCWPQRETGLCVPSHSPASEQRPTALPGSPDLSPPGCGCRASPKGRGQEVVTNRCLVTLQTCSPGPPPGCVPGPPGASEGR